MLTRSWVLDYWSHNLCKLITCCAYRWCWMLDELYVASVSLIDTLVHFSTFQGRVWQSSGVVKDGWWQAACSRWPVQWQGCAVYDGRAVIPLSTVYLWRYAFISIHSLDVFSSDEAHRCAVPTLSSHTHIHNSYSPFLAAFIFSYVPESDLCTCS